MRQNALEKLWKDLRVQNIDFPQITVTLGERSSQEGAYTQKLNVLFYPGIGMRENEEVTVFADITGSRKVYQATYIALQPEAQTTFSYEPREHEKSALLLKLQNAFDVSLANSQAIQTPDYVPQTRLIAKTPKIDEVERTLQFFSRVFRKKVLERD